MPNSWIAFTTTPGVTWPCWHRAERVATTMCAASISKKRRRASRVSLRPKPSVPSEVKGRGIQRETMSGTLFR